MKLGEVLWRGLDSTGDRIQARIAQGEAIEDVIESFGGHPYFRAGVRKRWDEFVARRQPDPLTLLSRWQIDELDRIKGAIDGLEIARWQVAITSQLLDEAREPLRREELKGSLAMARSELRCAMRTLKKMGLLRGDIPPAAPLLDQAADLSLSSP